MGSICFYFQVHQPFRLRQDYNFFNIGTSHFYEDEETNRKVMNKIAEKCYLPANDLMMELIEKHNGRFKIAYSLSGLALEQFEKYAPRVLDSFIKLYNTGHVELLAETYYHSLAFQYSKKEFRHQVKMHQDKIQEIFGAKPTTFRNTELIYNNALAKEVKSLGFKTILTEGSDSVLGWQSPNFVYTPTTAPKVNLLLKNYKLSDDIAFRFSNSSWEGYPLTAEKYANWLEQACSNGDIVNLFMDYETFGEHQWADTGIFDFLWNLPEKVLSNTNLSFNTPSEVSNKYKSKGKLDVPNFVSWADTERDLSAWAGNDMQASSLNFIYSLENLVTRSGRKDLEIVWRKLQSSDHFYYMSTKGYGDGDVHSYFNPYSSPYDAFVIYNNVVTDLKKTLEEHKKISKSKTSSYRPTSQPPASSPTL